jgi:hypothetical protein
MNIDTIKTQGFRGLITAATIATLAACGGGGGGGGSDDAVSTSGSTPVVARGVITQLGSIHVHGVKYELPATGNYSSDDDNPSGDDVAANLVYQVGQMVSLRGRIDPGGFTGIADEVEYEAEIEGASVDGVINGITILRTQTTNNGPGIPAVPASLPDGRYEVSGVWMNDFTIEATYIKTDDDGDTIDEIKGEVQVVNSASSFDVKDITFNMAGGVPHGVSAGDYVEVHFALCVGVSPDMICTASEVEIEDDLFDRAEGFEIEIEGAVDKTPADCPPEAQFKVDDICVDADSKPAEWLDGLEKGKFDDLVQGSRVEVEGHMISHPTRDYLRADKVKGRGNRVRISSIASVIAGPPCSFTLIEGNINVTVVDCDNAFEGEAENSPGSLAIGNLEGEEVEVRGVRTGDREMMALRIKADGLSSGNRHELRAEVDIDGVNENDLQVTVMGIVTQGVSGVSGTELKLNDAPFMGSLSQFLSLIDDNTLAVDGPRDIIDVDFEIDPGDGSDVTPYVAHEYEIEEEDD